MRAFFSVIGVCAVIAAGIFAVSYFGYGLTSFFAPRYEAVRRDTMLNSRSYDEGAKRELYRLKLQYEQAKTDSERDTIAAAARHEFQIFPQERLPVDLHGFMVQVGGSN